MKKLNKLFAILVSLAMMATMCVVMAFADPDPTINTSNEVYLTKTWSTNDGTSTPEMNFNFTITQDKINGVANTQNLSAGDAIHFDANQTGTKMSANLLAGATWKDGTGEDAKVVPGKYVYTITENVPTEDQYIYTETAGSNNGKTTTTKTTTYSEKTYTMEVYVNKAGEVEGVVVKSDDGKVTSTKPGTPGEDGLVSPNGFNFENTYSEKVTTTPTGSDSTDPDPNDPDDEIIDGATAYVEKEITADNADQIDTDKAFDFSTTVTFPDIDASNSYTAKVVDKTGAVLATKTFTKPDTADDNGKYTATQTYQLRHGDRLVFDSIDVGAKFTAIETGTYDGYTKVAGGEITTPATITTAKNFAKIQNNFTKGGNVPDSGIIISNLPYIVLALVAIGGLVAYVVVRRRQSDEA